MGFPPATQPRPSTLTACTPTGHLSRIALWKNRLSYKTWDFTAEDYAHALLKQKVAEDMKAEFEAEGNLFLYQKPLWRSLGGDQGYRCRCPQTLPVSRHKLRWYSNLKVTCVHSPRFLTVSGTRNAKIKVATIPLPPMTREAKGRVSAAATLPASSGPVE